MRKEQIKQALLDGAELAYNMIEVRHELHCKGETFTVRFNTVLKLKEELDLIDKKTDVHNRAKTDVKIVKNNTHMTQEEIKERLSKVKKDNKEVIELKEEEVEQINENTFTYKGKKVSVYGKADKCNNMAIEGWLEDDEYSVIYSEGYNTYEEAVKAVINDSFRRYGNKFDIEEISFI